MTRLFTPTDGSTGVEDIIPHTGGTTGTGAIIGLTIMEDIIHISIIITTGLGTMGNTIHIIMDY